VSSDLLETVAGGIPRRLLGWLLVLLTCGPLLGALIWDGTGLRRSDLPVSGCVVLVAAGLLIGASRPLTGALLGSVGLLIVAISGVESESSGGAVSAGSDFLLVAVFVLALRLGATGWVSRVVGVGALIISMQVNGPFNPLGEMVTIGPCAIGVVLASRQRLATRLAERAAEIEHERARYAEESVRLERARIARELHDIVAHCVSLVVVQAGAGQRKTDPAFSLEAFDVIAGALSAAQNEIDLLVDLLASGPPELAAPADGLELMTELVERARATGMEVTMSPLEGLPPCPPEIGDLVYRTVQEGLTNALKHAPGAAVAVAVTCIDGVWSAVVTNGPAVGQPVALGRAGGGFGLPGMQERVAALGGALSCGPDAAGGWALSITLR
jgi:signal transduction histidine kinase